MTTFLLKYVKDVFSLQAAWYSSNMLTTIFYYQDFRIITWQLA